MSGPYSFQREYKLTKPGTSRIKDTPLLHLRKKLCLLHLTRQQQERGRATFLCLAVRCTGLIYRLHLISVGCILKMSEFSTHSTCVSSNNWEHRQWLRN